MRSMVLLLGACLLGACDSSDDLCGAGDDFEHEGVEYCVYRAAIIEEGFRCPDAFSHRIDFESFTACSERESAPPEDFRERVEREVLRLSGDASVADSSSDASSDAPPTTEFECGGLTRLVRTKAELLGAIPTTAELSIDIAVEGEIRLLPEDLPEGAGGRRILRLHDHRAIEGVDCRVEPPMEDECAELIIRDTRFRGSIVTAPAFTGGDVVLTMVRSCQTPCDADELACAELKQCLSWELHCELCQHRSVEECTCHTQDGPEPDGSECRYLIGIDGPYVPGTCTDGMCHE